MTEPTETQSFFRIALDYAQAAIKNEHGTFGSKIVKAAKRFLKDLDRSNGHNPPFLFDPDTAQVYCEFIELLPHVEGKWDTPTIKLVPAQVFVLVQLFGFRNFSGGRRFTTLLFNVARKNAKSTLAAAIMIACFCLEDENGPQAISAATTGQQARIVFNIIKSMITKRPDLQAAFKLALQANKILCEDIEKLGTMKPINSKASTQDGLNPTYTCLDELHAHKTHDLLNVLMSASGARSNPLWLYTTTEGYDSPGPWPEQRNFAEQILDELIEADHYLAIIYSVDDKDEDEFEERIWFKANPLMEHNPLLLTEMRKLAIEAKAMPGNLAEFKIKRLNRPTSTALGEIDLLKWKACAGEIDLKEMERYRCFASFDLASVLDMVAWRLLWDLGSGKWATWGRFWVPENQVKLRTVRNVWPYGGWVKSGYLTQTPGEVTDYEIVEREIREDIERFGPEEITYDPWNATSIAGSLDKSGYSLKQFIQGTKSYNPAFQHFEAAYIKGDLTHEDNKVMNWHMANLIARRDANNCRAPDRKKSKDKIDGGVTLLMCHGLAAAEEDAYVTPRTGVA